MKWSEKDVFSRMTLKYFTSNEINTYWTCGTSGFTFTRSSSNEKDIFATSNTTSAGSYQVVEDGSPEKHYHRSVIIGNKKYKIYDQYSYKDESEKLANGCCGAAAVATVLSAYNIEKTPKELYDWYAPLLSELSTKLTNNGISNTHYYMGKSDSDIANMKAKIKANLQKGQPVIVLVGWHNESDTFYTYSGGHFITLVGIQSDETVFVTDSVYGKFRTDANLDKVMDYMDCINNDRGCVLINE